MEGKLIAVTLSTCSNKLGSKPTAPSLGGQELQLVPEVLLSLPELDSEGA